MTQQYLVYCWWLEGLSSQVRMGSTPQQRQRRICGNTVIVGMHACVQDNHRINTRTLYNFEPSTKFIRAIFHRGSNRIAYSRDAYLNDN
jgi:hypothetical protein